MQDLEGFKYFLASRRGKKATKPSTRAVYLQTLTMLHRETKLDAHLLRQFINTLVDKGRQPSYINRLIVVLHLWGEYKQDPAFKAFKLFEPNTVIKSIMSDSEIEAFLAVPGSLKWRMFWTCLAYSGCRPGEIATLNTSSSSVDLGRGIFGVDGKTGYRPVPIAPAITGDVTAYIKTLSGDLLFPGSNNTPVTRQAWGQDFAKRIQKIGIKRKGLSPHSLRHSFITRMLNEDVNLFKVQKIVGHKNIETTAVYTHLTTKDIIHTMQFDPLARKQLSKTDKLLMARKALESLGFIVTALREQSRGFLFEVLDEALTVFILFTTVCFHVK